MSRGLRVAALPHRPLKPLRPLVSCGAWSRPRLQGAILTWLIWPVCKQSVGCEPQLVQQIAHRQWHWKTHRVS
jgi:hypothetical protein